MILQLFLGLIVIALIFSLIGSERRRRIWSVLLFGAVLVLLYAFFEQINAIGIHNVIYSWIPHKTLQANISFTDVGGVHLMSLCFAVLIYLNIIYRKEVFSLYINNLILFNFAALIILISSQDFIQLMIGSSCFSILGFYLINDIKAKNKFIFYNFLAELAIFTALAVVYSKLNVITLSALPLYLKQGYHKDLVSLLLLAAVFVKCGLFLFQNQLLDLKDLTFNRVIIIAMFSTPLSGVIIFNKLFPLIGSSDLARPIFEVLIVLSVVWAVMGTLLKDSLKAKILYFNMLFYSFILWHSWGNTGLFFEKIIYLYVPLLAVYCSLLFTSISASDESYVSEMGGFFKKLWFNLFLSLLAVFVLFGVFVRFFPQEYGLELFGILLAICFHAVFFGKPEADERVEALLTNIGWLFWLPFTIILGYLIYHFKFYTQVMVWEMLAGFILLMLVVPAGIFKKFAHHKFIQEGDMMHHIYEVILLMPLRFIGRILWIAIDFVIIERSVIGSVSNTTRFVVRGLQKIQNAYWVNYLFMVLLGLAIILINLGWYYYE